MVANNPQTFMNGYLSALRNSIITVSLGVAIYGFSRSFKKASSRSIMKRLSVLVYFFSFFIIINSSFLLRKYLNNIPEKDMKEMPAYVDLQKWRYYEYLGWFFTVIIFLLITLGLSEDMIDLFQFVLRQKN